MPVSIKQETRDRIGVTHYTPKPTDKSDPNYGKTAWALSGVFKDLRGVLYPRHFEVKYEKLIDESALGTRMGSEKMYLLLYFFKDTNEFFCAIPVDPLDIEVEGGYVGIIPGDGTLADPHPCGYEISSGNGTDAKYYLLPNRTGTIRIDYDLYSAPDKIDIYYANDPDTLVATTGVRTGVGFLEFYYDPAFNGDIMIVKVSDGIRGTYWQYKVNCPKD